MLLTTILLLFSGHLHAQDVPDTQRAAVEQELEQIREQIRLGSETRTQLSGEIAALEKDRATLNAELIAASAKARQFESRINRNTRRLVELREEESAVRESLKGRRALLADVLAALQRMGRNPPPAILLHPDDATRSIRAAILLGSVVPEIRAETGILATELAEFQRIANDIETQRESLRTNLASLAQEEERLSLLLAEKKELTSAARARLAGQRAKAVELAARESNLGELIAKLEREVASARKAALASKTAEEERLRKEAEQLASARREIERPDFSDTARIAPAMAFEDTRGLLPRPANGVEIHGFGQVDRFGEEAAGVSLATRVNARIVAPADGWVVYAGPFRSYGQLLILNAGSGYHIVLAGMETINAELGSFVLAGEPVAMMGARRIASAEAVGVESSRPVLYVEFRKDGKSIDPSPWWADTDNERNLDDS